MGGWLAERGGGSIRISSSHGCGEQEEIPAMAMSVVSRCLMDMG
jgi:hypothetical protein